MSALDPHSHDSHDSHDNENVRFEPSDVSTRPVALAVLALAFFTVAFTLVAHFVFKGLAERQRLASRPSSPVATQYAAKQPPEPRLQQQPKVDLDLLRAAEAKTLGTLGWVDRNAGIVQVPIDRAMEILVAKGLPARRGAVPLKMSPLGVAPAQIKEGENAPDWSGGYKIGHDRKGDHGAEGAHAAAAEERGH